MIRNVLFAAVLASVSAAAGAATPASSGATLSVDKGTVLVNNGTQFVTAKPGQAIKAGDRIMVMQGGHATLHYGNGTNSGVNSGSLFSVGSASASNAGAALPKAPSGGASMKFGPVLAQAVGDDVHADSAERHSRARPPLWAVFATFAVVSAVALSEGNSDGISQP